MKNYNLEENEVILYEGNVKSSNYKECLNLTLTSKKIVFEVEKGIIKKRKELVDIIPLSDIKIYNEKVQISKKGVDVNIQTIDKNIKLSFDGVLKANKFVTNVINAITNTTITQRSTDKVKSAINTIDDVLGIDTRGTLKNVVESGITSTILKGIKKNK